MTLKVSRVEEEATIELPQCFGSGWYEVKLHGYGGAFNRRKRSPRECHGCEIKRDCFESRDLWARERRSR